MSPTNLNMQIWPEYVCNDGIVYEPVGQILAVQLRHGLAVAQLVVEVNVDIDVGNAGQSHRQSGAREVLEGKIQPFSVKLHSRLSGILHECPHEI
jgi:hypothetical protein